MASVVDLCNMALSRVGVTERINALDEDGMPAEQCSLFYETSRDFVLRAYNWGFATAFADLAEVASNPDPAFSHSYSMPVDCLTIRRIIAPGWPDIGFCRPDDLPVLPQIPYRVINGDSGWLIATASSPATIEYTKRITAPEMFPPDFVSALAWRLAAQIAPGLAKDAAIAQTCQQAYEAEVRQAQASGLNEGVTALNFESSFIAGRN